ncbi:HAD-IA family hydrolase [Metabacillus fastidiosus]|uniref:HAD family hydrolase n=1 Tax=Metabacillus fastidiosus TaxID=1458 RepID=UPI003D26EB2E
MVNMKKLKAVIFDLDDTLHPEMDYVLSGFRVVSEHLSININAESKVIYESLISLFEKDRGNVFDSFLTLYEINKEKLVQQCIDLYRDHYPNIKLKTEVYDLLKWLKEHTFKIGIITDGRPEGQWNKIKALRLEEFCDKIIVTDELGGIQYRKPCEVSYIQMLNSLGVLPSEAVYIGDNPTKDFVTANKLGITTIMIKNDRGMYSQSNISRNYAAHLNINELEEIKKIICGECIDL